MRLHLRIDHRTPEHVNCTVYVNGANAGQLTMRAGEYVDFRYVCQHGTAARGDVFEQSYSDQARPPAGEKR